MRTLVAALLSIVLAHQPVAAIGSCPSGAKLLDEKFGFRDVKFDARVEDIADLRQTSQQSFKTKRVKAFIRPTDSLEIFHQPLIAITYFFFDDRLFLVELQLSARGDPIAVLQGFHEAFGCEFEKSDGPAGQVLSLTVVGEKAKFYGSVHIDRTAIHGNVLLQRVGIQQAIDEAIKKEAASQF